MKRIAQGVGGSLVWLLGALCSAGADGLGGTEQGKAPRAAAAPEAASTGVSESVNRDIQRVRAATNRFKSPDQAVAAGYQSTDQCVEHQPAGAMGLHFDNNALRDATLDVEKPEVLVYEKLPDGSLKLNGVEYIVPIAAWKRDEPPMIMGQNLKRAEQLGFWYLHVWIWAPNPSGVFADWNPNVKCLKPSM